MEATKALAYEKVFGYRISARILFIGYAGFLFVIPLIIGWPQLLVGSIVNFFLILVALRYRKFSLLLPMVMLPTIAASFHGVVFGALTMYMLYMMPAIRIGNYILIYAVQYFKNLQLGIFVGAWAKAIFLVLIAAILVYFWILPTIFIKFMWIFQLLTALIGWTGVLLIKRKLF